MRSHWIRMGIALLSAVALFGCAAKSAPPLSFAPQPFESGKKCIYTAKKDHAQFILDASLTMGEDEQANLNTAKNFIGAVNQSLPSDYAGSTGLRTFGHSEKQSKKETELLYGMAKHSRDGLQKGLDSVKFAGGNSPLGVAIEAAAADIEKAGGSSVLVVVSDGIQNYMDDAVGMVKKAKAKLGDKLCVTTVWVGDDAGGKKYLEGIVAAAGCGTAESASALTDAAALGAFVEKTFLVCNPPPPPVAAPAPPPPPAPAPPPPPPAPVKQKEIITLSLLFDFDKAVIKDEFVPVLEQAKKILNEDPAESFTLSGHTCNIGTDAYNQKLSERRAAAVKKWLVDNGIAAERLGAAGFGESQPKYDNKTKEGRELNRRVEIQSK